MSYCQGLRVSRLHCEMNLRELSNFGHAGGSRAPWAESNLPRLHLTLALPLVGDCELHGALLAARPLPQAAHVPVGAAVRAAHRPALVSAQIFALRFAHALGTSVSHRALHLRAALHVHARVCSQQNAPNFDLASGEISASAMSALQIKL